MWFTFPISVVTQPSQRSHTVVVATKNTMATLLLLNCVSCPHHQKVDLRIGFFRNRLEVQFAGSETLQRLRNLTRRIASKAAPIFCPWVQTTDRCPICPELFTSAT